VPTPEFHGTRLRALLAGFLDERDAAANRQAVEGVVQHAAFLKVHLMSVLGLDESILFVRKQTHDTASRLSITGLHITALSPSKILQPAPGDIERFSDGHMGVLTFGIGFSLLGRCWRIDVLRARMKAGLMRNDDFSSRYGQVDPHVTTVAGLVMTLGELDEHSTTHDWAVVSFKLFNPPADICFEGWGGLNTTKCNRWWELHIPSPEHGWSLQATHHVESLSDQHDRGFHGACASAGSLQGGRFCG